jgi:small conductance mechanosensitive channel
MTTALRLVAALTILAAGLIPPVSAQDEQAPAAGVEQDASAEARAAELEARVDAEAARIEADPPVHERPEPWSVSLSEFENELQPLRADQIDERVNIWLAILQDQVRRRNRLNIAAEQTEDAELRQALLARAAARQETIGLVVTRVETAILELKRRGGDTAEYESYVANVTGSKLNLNDPRLLADQAMTWVRSPSGGIAIAVKAATFIGVLIAFWIVSRIAVVAVRAGLSRVKNASELLKNTLTGGVRRIVMAVGLVMALAAIGVSVGPLLALIGAAGLVIGLALQGTLSNFASGILILIYKPFDVGHVVTAGGVTGKVDAMNLVRTSILTFDNQIHYVPNNEIWNSVITNITGRSTRRVDMVFGIGYGDDMAKAQAIIEGVVSSHEKVLADPAPVIKVNELADSSVNFIVRPWSKTVDYWDVYWDITRAVKERFDAEGVGIPFPQRDLHLPAPIEVVVKQGSITEPKGAGSTANA